MEIYHQAQQNIDCDKVTLVHSLLFDAKTLVLVLDVRQITAHTVSNLHSVGQVNSIPQNHAVNALVRFQIATPVQSLLAANLQLSGNTSYTDT